MQNVVSQYELSLLEGWADLLKGFPRPSKALSEVKDKSGNNLRRYVGNAINTLISLLLFRR